jgi:hypothetical protein
VIARLLATGALVAMPPRHKHKHSREGLIGLAILLFAWAVMVWVFIWLNL